MVKSKIIIVTQARLGSSRLPGKVLKPLGKSNMLTIHLERLSLSKLCSKIIVATTHEVGVEKIIDVARNLNIETYKGSIDDVLDRFYQSVINENADYIVRVTSDCPLIDPKLIDSVIEMAIKNDLDYCANILIEEFPDGQDIEVFKFSALKLAWEKAISKSDREHVTPYIRNNSTYKGKNTFTSDHFSTLENYNHVRMTVDEPEDLIALENVISALGQNSSWLEYTKYILKNTKELGNQKIIRNEGYTKSLKNNSMKKRTGQNLYVKAKKLIPGGTMLLSKRPEMFLPENWPAYFSKAKGMFVWDLDGNKYKDMTIMGIGTNTLGYGHEEVDAAVSNVIQLGNMSTFSCPEEVALAEKLIEINPWADMVRFARTGGEANSIAIRIARAASGRDQVAICGYHGWHDWYLSANHNDGDELSSHLLPGLSPNGVPKNLKNTVFPFRYNNIDELKQIVQKNNIGVIKMEVVRNFGPENNFLNEVRALATENNIVLVFDECTSGFRETFGGIYQKFNVEPDVIMYGKTIGNGYALTAIVGRREIMESAQTSFISSTFWTERIGPTAALKTLEVMEKIKSWETITKKGKIVRNGWLALADNNGLKINISGIPSLSTYSFESKNALKYKTFITQEMLKKGFLASTNFYACIAHREDIIEEYLNELNEVFKIIKKCEDGDHNIDTLLEGPVSHSGFQRLN